MYKTYLKKTAYFLMPALLVVYSLMLANQGITVTDTGYNYGNFVNFDSLDGMWKFSTYLATVVGAFFTRLPGGHTMLGLNLYTGLVKALIAVVTYLVCVHEFKIRRGIAFLAELMALGYCWCPTALLYNYITYLLFTLGAVFLCIAVKRQKNVWYLIAGVCLGLNVMVRLPNLAEMALILAVWFHCFLQKTKLAETLKRTGFCILGYLAGIGVVMCYIAARYGLAAYLDGIQQILSMPSEASSYSVKAMIVGDFYRYLHSLKWLLVPLGFVAAGTVFYAVAQRRDVRLKRVLYLLCNLLILPVYYKMHMFRFAYHTYDAIYHPGILFLMIAGILGLYVMFFGGKDYVLRMHAITMGIVILITPLGSNNGLLTAENNLFWAIPFVFHCAYQWVLAAKHEEKKKLTCFTEPLRITCLFLLLFVFAQGVLFGATFVFRDGVNGEKRAEKMTEIPALAGMYTHPENAESLRSLYGYLEAEDLLGKEVILYRDLPGLAFYMDLKPAMSSTWPDLASFVTDKFEQELDRISEACMSGKERPLIIVGRELDPDAVKDSLLKDFCEALQYEPVFRNEMCVVYR